MTIRKPNLGHFTMAPPKMCFLYFSIQTRVIFQVVDSVLCSSCPYASVISQAFPGSRPPTCAVLAQSVEVSGDYPSSHLAISIRQELGAMPATFLDNV